jgi:hypothetical protein
VWRIPPRRILRFARVFDIKKGQPFVWQWYDCHQAVVIPGTYKHIHGEIVKIDPKTLEPSTEVVRYCPLLQYSNIPLFQEDAIRRMVLQTP